MDEREAAIESLEGIAEWFEGCTSDNGWLPDEVVMAGLRAERLREIAALLRAPQPACPEGWRDGRPMSEAPKDGTRILVLMRGDLPARTGRHDLDRWNDRYVVVRHEGFAGEYDLGWSVAAPVGHGGLPDAWIARWWPLPLPAPPGGA
jgi:hypothetical protein